MSVFVDKLTDMVLKSLRKYLADTLPGSYSGVHISGPDFKHDTKGDGSGKRGLPYVTLVYQSEETEPFEVRPDDGARVQRNIDLQLWVVCEDFLATFVRPQQVQQALQTSVVDDVPAAVPLLDFDTGPPTASGFFEVMTGPIVPHLDIDEKSKWRNLKHVGIVTLRIEEEKVRTAKLIET